MKVSVDETGVLHWPVYFLYPEHSDSDFIQQFPETDRYSYTTGSHSRGTRTSHLLLLFQYAFGTLVCGSLFTSGVQYCYRLCDHIELMFGPDSDRPGWDKDGRYVPENITVRHLGHT